MLESVLVYPRIVLNASLIAINTLIHALPLLLLAAIKLLVPVSAFRNAVSRVLVWIAESWIQVNSTLMTLLAGVKINVDGMQGLQRKGWYLVICNHQSWVDIPVLQKVFNRRIPFLKFFLKQELIWVPFLGLAWWALDFPFMKRHSATYLQKHPQARGEDLDATRKACERFALLPTSVMNFVEGTRYTTAKHKATKSPYRHLLRPRPGGVAFVLSAMGGMLHSVLDVTVAYSESSPTFWDLCCGRLGPVRMHVLRRPIEPWVAQGDYAEDSRLRARFKQWLGVLWTDKDARLDTMLPGHGPGPAAGDGPR